MKSKRTIELVQRELTALDLLQMQKRISYGEYKRRTNKLEAEMKGLRPNTVTSVSIGYDVSFGVATETKPLTMSVFQEMLKRFRSSSGESFVYANSDAGDAMAYGTSYYGALASPGVSPAQLWDECEGVMLCECENPDCLKQLNITKEEYVKASYPINVRLTHPDCGYGILFSQMIHRQERWNSWSKEY